MNTSNNKRKKESQEKIKSTFLKLIQKYEINEISVSDICKLSNINRSTFYANYIDIYDLADKIKEEMFLDIAELYTEERLEHKHSYNYLKLFKHIKDNQIFYNTLFKLGFEYTEYSSDNRETEEALKYLSTTDHIDYHIEFFKAGMNAIIKKWLKNGCKESPEEINNILLIEYKGKSSD